MRLPCWDSSRPLPYLPRVALTCLPYAVILCAPSLAAIFGVGGMTIDDAARLVGMKFPAIKDRLANAIQVMRAVLQSQPQSVELAEAAFERALASAKDLDLHRAVDTRPARRAAVLALLALAAPLLMLGVSQSSREAFTRLVRFTDPFTPPAPFILTVTPGSVFAIKGDSVRVTITATGREPVTELSLRTTEIGQEVPHEDVLHSRTGSFSYTLPGIRRTLAYQAAARGIESEIYTITVRERPEIQSLTVHLDFPSYTGASSIDLAEHAGDIVALKGTRALITVRTNKPVHSARVIFTRTDSTIDSLHALAPVEIPLAVTALGATGTLTVHTSGTYCIQLVDADGITNPEPISYSITALADEMPTIQLVRPTGSNDVTDASSVGVVTQIHDDYGFSKLLLHYRLTQSKFAKPWTTDRTMPVQLTPGLSTLEVPYVWDLKPLSLVPEDAIEFFMEVFDNDVITGPKSARSESAVLRLPSLETALRESDQTQAAAGENLQEAQKAAEELRKQMEQTTRELRQHAGEKNLSWQQQKRMQDMVRKQEQLQQKVEEAEKKLEESLQKLEENRALSPETMQKYMELQKLFQELKNPDLMNAMRKMQEAMEKMSPDQMREAMKNFSFNEEQFRQSIERTMELLKRIQTEQKVDEMMARAKRLEEEQQRLQDQTNSANSPQQSQELSAQQKDLAQRAKELEQEFKDLQKKMKEMGKEAPTEEMQKAERDMRDGEISSEMQQASQELQQSQPQSASPHQQNARQGLQQFQKNMAAVKKQMQSNQQKQAMAEMRRSLQDLLELSRREEAIKQQTDRSEPNSSQLPDLARQQASAQNNLNGVVDRMMKLSQKSFNVTPQMGKELGTALREMNGAGQSLEQRQPPQASQREGGAIGALNRSAMLMQQALEQMSQGNQGSGGGMQSFMQQLQQMGQQQEGINQGMPQMGKGMNPGSMSREQQAQMGRMMGEQQAVKKSLEQLQKEQQQLTGGKKNTLGDLNKIAEDMQEVINDMKNNNVRPETIQRQEKILSRLLDAQHSQHERDFDKKREGNAARTAPARPAPEQLAQSEINRANQLLELQRGSDGRYTKDYESRIRNYLDRVKRAARP
jgi:hypothetical protein